MSAIRRFIGRIRLGLRKGRHIVGWSMKPEDAVRFIKGRGKTVLTFYGYSGMGYEREEEMLRVARDVLARHSPATTLVNIGGTKAGIGAVYPLARSLGFETTAVVSTRALQYPQDISESVDHLCLVEDRQYGGNLPGSAELSPTSRAMVDCSDILVAIGGGDVSRDELLEAKRQGKPIQYHPAEFNHENAVRLAGKKGEPPPASFMGAVHDVFGK